MEVIFLKLWLKKAKQWNRYCNVFGSYEQRRCSELLMKCK